MKKTLESCHSSRLFGHYDTNKTCKKVSEQYYWPGMLEDVKEFCQSCEQCQKTNRL